MAFDKPHRDIEGRPRAVRNNPHKHCMHSLTDDKKLTKVSTAFLENIYEFSWKNEVVKKFKRLKKLKHLIMRRKLKQKMNKSKR